MTTGVASGVLDAVRALPEGGVMRIAKAAGVGYRTLYRIRNEPDHTPSLRTIEMLRPVLMQAAPATGLEADRYAELPLLRHVAGGQPRQDAREPLTLAFRRDWLERFLGAKVPEEHPEQVAYLVRVKGDSMAPAIRSGDVALCHRWEPGHGIVEGGLYLLHLDGGETVKRLMGAGPGKVKAFADNRDAGFTSEPIDLEGRDVREIILARVRWHAHKEE